MSEREPLRSQGAPPPSISADPAWRGATLRLAQRATEGDTRATRQLLEMVAPRVVRAVGAVMGRDHPDLEDAVQLSLIGFVQALSSFRGECHPVHFAARIAVRAAGAARRSRTRSSAQETSVDLDAMEGTPVRTGRARRTAVLRGLLDDLPEEQAETLALRVALGWSLAEIASATGVPANTVRSRLRLAKEALRRRIADDPELLDELDTSEIEA